MQKRHTFTFNALNLEVLRSGDVGLSPVSEVLLISSGLRPAEFHVGGPCRPAAVLMGVVGVELDFDSLLAALSGFFVRRGFLSHCLHNIIIVIIIIIIKFLLRLLR